MSMLIHGDDDVMNYVVADIRNEKVLAAHGSFGQADRAMKAMKWDGHDDLAVHNITHGSCPDWIKSWVKADAVYCERQATISEHRASALRAQAESLLEQAKGLDERALRWRMPAEEPTAVGS